MGKIALSLITTFSLFSCSANTSLNQCPASLEDRAYSLASEMAEKKSASPSKQESGISIFYDREKEILRIEERVYDSKKGDFTRILRIYLKKEEKGKYKELAEKLKNKFPAD